MRINVYSQELTDETMLIIKEGTDDKGEPATFYGVRMMLHSSEMLHHAPDDDDRSGITFWLPKSRTRRMILVDTFRDLIELIETEVP